MNGRDPCDIRADLHRLFATFAPDTRRDRAVAELDAAALRPHLQQVIDNGRGGARAAASRLLTELCP